MNRAVDARHDRGEQGSETLSAAMLYPLFLLVIFTVIALALYGFAVSTAQSAASACAESARNFTATAADGQTAAHAVLSSTDSLTDPSVSVDRTGTVTTCTITGSVLTPMEGLLPRISRSVSMPTERVTQP